MDQKPSTIFTALSEDSWHEIRFWRRLLWGGWLLFVPVVGGLGGVLTNLGITENLVLCIALLWMAAWAFIGIKLQLCRCPNCNERFFSHAIGGLSWFRLHNAFALRCLNCKVRIGTSGIPPKKNHPDILTANRLK